MSHCGVLHGILWRGRPETGNPIATGEEIMALACWNYNSNIRSYEGCLNQNTMISRYLVVWNFSKKYSARQTHMSSRASDIEVTKFHDLRAILRPPFNGQSLIQFD